MRIPLKVRLCVFLKWIPRFYEDMPKEKIGRWKAGYLTPHYLPSAMCGQGPYFLDQEFTSLQEAYVAARWEALKADWSVSGNFGVNWIIQAIKENSHADETD